MNEDLKMSRHFKVVTNMGQNKPCSHKFMIPEVQLKHFRNVISSVLQNAHDTWADIWNEFKDTVTEKLLILPEAEEGRFKPRCGWPEFLERIWLLKHYIDYAIRFSKGED